MTDGGPGTTQPDASTPVTWQRLARELRTAIERGELRPGTPAPSITALARGGRAGTRQACAMALRSLEADGLLTRRPGIGYYVPEHLE